MRPFLIAVAAALAAVAAPGQPLVCPTTPAGTCAIYHFHVQMFRPDTRGFADLFGINQFATQQACDSARENAVARNAAVVDHIRRTQNDQQYQPDRFGPCHCDMTVDRSSPNFLSDADRAAQIRTASDIRQRVRERLMDTGLSTDAELIRNLVAPSALPGVVGGPRIVSLPAAQVAASQTTSPDELRTPKMESAAAPAIAADLPLADVQPGIAAPAATAAIPVPAPPPAPPPVTLPAEEPAAAEQAADIFVSVETQRIQNVLKASDAVSNETLKAKILESCMQRIQLLSNLRSLIQSSGATSRLATAARNARSDQDRLALVDKLFGADVAPHWAPKDATAVVLPPLTVDAQRVLRDTTGKFSERQKRRALYELLARTQPNEDEQLWLATIVEALLRS